MLVLNLLIYRRRVRFAVDEAEKENQNVRCPANDIIAAHAVICFRWIAQTNTSERKKRREHIEELGGRISIEHVSLQDEPSVIQATRKKSRE